MIDYFDAQLLHHRSYSYLCVFDGNGPNCDEDLVDV